MVLEELLSRLALAPGCGGASDTLPCLPMLVVRVALRDPRINEPSALSTVTLPALLFLRPSVSPLPRLSLCYPQRALCSSLDCHQQRPLCSNNAQCW